MQKVIVVLVNQLPAILTCLLFRDGFLYEKTILFNIVSSYAVFILISFVFSLNWKMILCLLFAICFQILSLLVVDATCTCCLKEGVICASSDSTSLSRH